MSEQLLPDLITPCSPADLYLTLQRAWSPIDGAPSRASLLVLLAHWTLETGGGHWCHRWNLGNVKHVPGDGHDFVQFRCNEIIAGKTVWILPPDPRCSFVAFKTIDEGAQHYLMGLRGRFRLAWPLVIAGDPAGFCHYLKIQNYYTAVESTYTAGVVHCFHQLDATLPIVPTVEQNIPTIDPRDTSTAPELANPPSDPQLPPNT